ncbi:penicillin-binding transpeptidase domain-containing protein [Tateyamaria sp. SN6-1]|uniref:penicillin-binding transpeptidase domain-containing protein n=1 Tax=Tateyamaria sp. SN6-1 TaxID=3092148 RepID=UPI0039F5D2E0
MRRALIVVLIALGIRTPALADPIDVANLVQAAGGDATRIALVIERTSDGQRWTANPVRSVQRFSPASTSKIPHTLIALDAGLATPDTVFAWDGVPRSARVWNQDHTLRTAFQKSVVWVFQRIAKAAGPGTMSDGLTRFGYGNMRIGTPDQITTYWLDNTLRISAQEQVVFLSKLASETLRLSGSTYAAARDMMVSDKTNHWVMRSKTGWWYSKTDMDIGWYVGWLECTEDTYVFALNMDMPDTRALSKRRGITYAVLERIGAFDCT